MSQSPRKTPSPPNSPLKRCITNPGEGNTPKTKKPRLHNPFKYWIHEKLTIHDSKSPSNPVQLNLLTEAGLYTLHFFLFCGDKTATFSDFKHPIRFQVTFGDFDIIDNILPFVKSYTPSEMANLDHSITYAIMAARLGVDAYDE